MKGDDSIIIHCRALKDFLLLEENVNQESTVNDTEDKATTTSSSLSAVYTLTAPQRARCALQHILRQVSVDHFYKDHWEQKPLWIPCSDPERNRFDGFLSSADMRTITFSNKLQNSVDFNVTRYEKDATTGQYQRQTLSTMNSTQAWDAYDHQGATIRWLRPQQHVPSIHALLSLMELEFGCMVGANAYLTPAGKAQGFAPHYDDIEAFLLQLEGSKRWRVYAPLETAATLPRVSSEDFTRTELGNPVLDVTLERGDALFLPRGWIHEAVTSPDECSLHLTLSSMQQWAWADLMELVLPEALEASIATPDTTLLREGLPIRFLDYMGVVHDDSNIPEILKREENGEEDEASMKFKRAALRDTFRTEAKKRMEIVLAQAMSMMDAACDQLGTRFLSERLPPALTKSEIPERNATIAPNTLCRLARPGIARLVLEEKNAVVYHCVDNSLVFQEVPLSPLEYDIDHGPALEQILTTVAPNWAEVSELHHDSIEEKIALVQSLYDEGILLLRN